MRCLSRGSWQSSTAQPVGSTRRPSARAGLRGQVVLVDFWTYTCINWLRTLGYVRAWAEKYEDQGLVVVGVHTPEFPFERDVDNVREAAKEMRVEYPIALDSDYAVWQAFGNHYWPAVYIADADGRIRHHQFGEGGYEECERIVQQLLREAGGDGISDDLVRGPLRRDSSFRPIGRTSRLPSPISGTSRPRASPRLVVQDATSFAPTTRPSSCARTSGLSPGTGRSGTRRACWTKQVDGSCFASTRATSTS